MMLFLEETPELNETDMIIYNYIIKNLHTMDKTTIRELSEATHTSTASVLRLCKKFKTSGFTEFKILLNSYLMEKHTLVSSSAGTDKLEDELIHFLTRAKDTQFSDQIDEAVNLLIDKELIVFLGIGPSNIVAEYGALYFSTLFKLAVRIEDIMSSPMDFLSKELSKKMCAIVLSVSGETKELVDYVNNIKMSSITIISITNNRKSTIAGLSDINIPYYVSIEKIEPNNITTQIPALYTVEKLAREVRKKKLDSTNCLN